MILAFTDGADNPGNLKTNNLTLMDVMERAQREDVMVYAIGLESRMPPRWAAADGGGGLSGGFGGGNAFGVQRPDPGLPTIAGETGGGYFELTGPPTICRGPSRASPTSCTANTRSASSRPSSMARRTRSR